MSTSNPATAGFILSMQTQQRRHGIYYVAWLATERGPVKVISTAQKAVFFIAQKNSASAERILSSLSGQYQQRTLTLKTFAGEPVCALYFSSLQDYYQGRELLREQGIELYEGDIRPQEQFLMERFIRGGVWVQGEASGGDNRLIRNARFKANDGFRPKLSMLSLDLECSPEGILYSVALVSEHSRRVFMIGTSPSAGSEQPWLEYVEDEAALLYALIEQIKNLDPDLIIGWNVADFDMQLLCFRAQQLGIELTLGRDGEAVIWRGGQVNKLIVPGRVVLDGIDMLKNATYHFNSYSLDNVAAEVLGECKLLEQGDKLGAIQRLFHQDKLKLAEYNLKDSELVLAIFNKLELCEFAVARAQLTGLPLERLGGSVAAFTNLYLPHLHRSGYVAPNLGDHGLSFDSPGGYVMDSTPGLYDNVAVLDFKSLYPSIIRTFCIDPMALILGLQQPQDSVPGFNHAYFSRTEHHLPQLVSNLAEARQRAKNDGDHHLQQAIKIIMNSLYGVLGSKGCRFYDPRLSSSITLRGHEIMQTTKMWLEELGVTVIYGDTDSTFVALPKELDEAQSHRVAADLVAKINQKWRARLKNNLKLTSYLELEYESLYRPFFMPKARHKDIGSKKRYAGLLAQADYRLVFKGMESVRSDWTQFARDFQQDLFNALFTGGDLQQVVAEYLDKLHHCDDVKLLTYSKRLGKDPDHYTKAIPPHVRAARGSDKGFSKGDWVHYVITLSGPKLLPTTQPLDLDHYLEKQLRPIIDDLQGLGININYGHSGKQFPLL